MAGAAAAVQVPVEESASNADRRVIGPKTARVRHTRVDNPTLVLNVAF